MLSRRRLARAMPSEWGSGTSAIELGLRAAGVTGEVITSPLTAPFTGLAILAAGAKPRFADINPETLLLDADHAGNRTTKKTAAVLPVHLYGQSCDLARFVRLGLPLIQDACQAHGVRCAGRPPTHFLHTSPTASIPPRTLVALVTAERSPRAAVKWPIAFDCFATEAAGPAM